MKIHRSKTHKDYAPANFVNKFVRPSQDFMNTLVDKAVQKEKLKEQQKEWSVGFCEGKTLENLFLFKYLGSLFSANGEQSHDVDSRITKAKNRCVTNRYSLRHGTLMNRKVSGHMQVHSEAKSASALESCLCQESEGVRFSYCIYISVPTLYQVSHT